MREMEMASDGLLARKAGEYAREKLAFLQSFIPPALSIAGSKADRVYIDLFAGPGRNITKDGAEFPGSPLVALTARASAKHGRGFSAAHLVNFKPEAATALRARIDRAVADGSAQLHRDQIHEHLGDTNVLLPSLMRALPQSAYILAFADITGVKHWPWSSVQQLKSQGHRSVDLYVLFPLEMTIERLLGINRNRARVYSGHLDAFFGTKSWRDYYAERVTSAQGAAFRAQLIQLYENRLRSMWSHVQVACAPGFSEDRALYRMFFATNHDAAQRAATWAKSGAPGGQRSLWD